MDRLGLGYPVLSKINPRIIMTSITAFGQTGPYAHYKAPDIVGMAMGGMVYLCGDEDRPPVRISYPQAWNHASLQGCVGTMFAHYYREMTGEGQHVDVSMQTCVIWTLMNATVTWDLNRINIKRGGAIRTREVQRGDKIVPYRQQEILPCKDGYVYLRVMGGAVGGEQCQILVQWMDEEGMASESMKQRDWMALDFFTITQEDVDSWEGPIKDFLMTHTREEIYQEALKRRLSIAPVGTPKMLLEDKQLAFRNFWVDVEHPELGTAITYPGWPVHQSETPWRLQRRAPLIGEHNDEIYEKELGFSKEQLSVLKACGVI
ncbi:MAG: hypothetical protein DRI26_06440 [Chloroflexi bacterium]|nr:MAG: hypothetical protein DRI26_06440 [Chloroflexota bacterium]